MNKWILGFKAGIIAILLNIIIIPILNPTPVYAFVIGLINGVLSVVFLRVGD